MKSKLLNGDCLIESDKIESGSVDLILTDLPYGNMNTDGGRKLGINEWDNAIEPLKIYEIANRILRKNGKMILFAQEPYTTELITKAIANIPFLYRAIWVKDNFANGLSANKAMVGLFEDILIFGKKNTKHDFEGLHPLREYQYKVFRYIGLNVVQISKITGTTTNSHYWTKGEQFSAISEKDYNIFIKHFGIDTMEGFIPFKKLKNIDDNYRTDLKNKLNNKYPSTFNLWEGGKFKSNVLEYRKDYNGYHPTQKPVLLLEDLIKTYSNKNNLIVDLTMGSGSTGVAARNCKRRFIGIEQDLKYFEIAQMRINKELKPPEQIRDENGFYQSTIFDYL